MNYWQKKLISQANTPVVKRLLRELPSADVFLVGGLVRDALLKRETADLDLVIRGANKVTIERALKTLGTVNFVGRRFGVYKLRPKNWPHHEIDIALPRTERAIEKSGSRKDFAVTSDPRLTIEDDLSRRDFTMNAMAWNIRSKTLIDPFDGAGDINKKIIRTVGNPADRFAEDYSRMMRAIRFACQLQFSIERKTWSAVKAHMKQLTKKAGGERVVAPEVIAAELNKMITGEPFTALSLLEKSGALALLIPELLAMKGVKQPKEWHTEGDVWKHTMLVVSNLFTPRFKKEFGRGPSAEVIWGALFHDIGKPPTMTITDRIRFNGHDAKSVKIFREVDERLRLSSAGLNTDAIGKIIGMHMLAANMKKTEVRDTTLEKYFFNEQFPGRELMMVMFADISGSLQKTKKPNFENYRMLKRRIERLQKLKRKNKDLPKPLLSGNELMKALGLKPGPTIGKLLSVLREAQLNGTIKTKKQALVLAKKTL